MFDIATVNQDTGDNVLQSKYYEYNGQGLIKIS